MLALLGAGTPPEGELWPADDRGMAAAGEGAARLSADAALSAVGRLLDPRAVAPHSGRRRCAAPSAEAELATTRASASPSREREDGAQRDPFILNRFEKIFAMAEMVNVDRPSDDSEDEDARKAADDLDELAISRRSGKPATKLKFDLDLPPEAVDAYAPGWRTCSIRNGITAAAPISRSLPRADADAARPARTGRPDETMRRTIRQVRRRSRRCGRATN